MENSKKGLKIFLSLISSLISFGLGGYSLYLSYLHNYWFILIGCYFLFEGLFIFISSLIKDGYKAMRFMGICQILGVIIMMDYLLVMILWNDPNKIMVYNLSYFVFGIAGGIKLFLVLISHISIHKRYNPVIHSYRNNDLITVFYLLLIIELIIVNYFYPGETTSLFDNLFKEKPIWIYIINIASNASLTIFAALLALSTDIRSKTKEELSTIGKIKHTVSWFNENEVSMFFGLIFTSYLAVLAFMNVKQNGFYIFLGIYYIGIALIRFINYLWHKGIEKHSRGNMIKDNRLSSWILLFDSLSFLFFSDAICAGAIILMINKLEIGTNIYLFLFMIIPFAIMRFINAFKDVRNYRRENNTYRLGVGYISLITAFFSVLEIIAIAGHDIHNTPIRYILIITFVVIIKIIVLVICVIFIVHWIRSLIINRKSKETRR